MKPPRTGLEAFLWKEDPYAPSSRDFFVHPFFLDGKIVATNGHIMVEWPSADLPVSADSVPAKVLDQIREWFAIEQADDSYLSLPPLPRFKRCPECNGDGLVTKTPGTTCGLCEGYGEMQQRIAVGNAGYCIRYLRLLSSLPNIQLAPNGEETMAAFRFTGGRGFLMPMRK
jgi:hypothetical protein